MQAPIWHRPVTPDDLNHNADNMLGHLGIVFTEVGPDYLRATMPVDHRTHQPFGLLHGGASVALAESLGSTGAMLCLDMARYQVVGIEVNANHIRAARSGKVTGTARAVHRGRSTHLWDIRIEDDAGKLVCVSRLTVAVLPKG